MTSKTIKGYREKNGKIEPIPDYGLDASAKRRRRHSKKVRVVKRKLPT